MSPVGIARLDYHGRVTYGNPRWQEMGYGDNFVDLVHPDDREIMEGLWRNALASLENVSFELRWGTNDQHIWVMGELVPEIVDEDVNFRRIPLM